MDKWIVHKFGGSSVADADCFHRVADIIDDASITAQVKYALLTHGSTKIGRAHV